MIVLLKSKNYNIITQYYNSNDIQFYKYKYSKYSENPDHLNIKI